MPCATADEESGSNLKLGSCVDQPFVLLGTRKLVLEMLSFKMNLCIKKWFSAKVNLNFILELPCALYSVYTPNPPWVWLDLLSMFVLTPFLIFTEEYPDFIPEDVE